MQSTRRRRTGGRRFFPRRKVCYFSAENKSPDYKDVSILRRFVSEWGKIDSRRRTGTRSRHQRKLAIAIKRARFLALLPYTGGHSQIELGRPDRGDRGRRFTPRDGGNNRFNAATTNNSPPTKAVEIPASDTPQTTVAPTESVASVSENVDETSSLSPVESVEEQPEE